MFCFFIALASAARVCFNFAGVFCVFFFAIFIQLALGTTYFRHGRQFGRYVAVLMSLFHAIHLKQIELEARQMCEITKNHRRGYRFIKSQARHFTHYRS